MDVFLSPINGLFKEHKTSFCTSLKYHKSKEGFGRLHTSFISVIKVNNLTVFT